MWQTLHELRHTVHNDSGNFIKHRCFINTLADCVLINDIHYPTIGSTYRFEYSLYVVANSTYPPPFDMLIDFKRILHCILKHGFIVLRVCTLILIMHVACSSSDRKNYYSMSMCDVFVTTDALLRTQIQTMAVYPTN